MLSTIIQLNYLNHCTHNLLRLKLIEIDYFFFAFLLNISYLYVNYENHINCFSFDFQI